jgi:heme/copper-type cytochrome/quinol oxidase subunit 2
VKTLSRSNWQGLSGIHSLQGARFFCALGWLIGLGSLAGCSQSAVRSNSLEPQGPAANQIADLWWLMLALGTITFLVVMGLLAWGLWRRRRGEESNYQIAKGRSQKLIVGGGVIFPAVILRIVFGFSLKTLSGLNGIQQEGARVIDVLGDRGWWVLDEPERGFTSARV